MSRRTVQARICWLLPDEGGKRVVPPPGARIPTIVRFPESLPDGGWTGIIICGPVYERRCGVVSLTFLVDEAPFEWLYTGNTFSLYDGPRIVARGQVL